MPLVVLPDVIAVCGPTAYEATEQTHPQVTRCFCLLTATMLWGHVRVSTTAIMYTAIITIISTCDKETSGYIALAAAPITTTII